MAEMTNSEDGQQKEQEDKLIADDYDISNKIEDKQGSDDIQEGYKGSNSITDNININEDEADDMNEEAALMKSPENIEDQEDLTNKSSSELAKRQERNRQMQLTMSRLEQCQFLDIQDPSTSQVNHTKTQSFLSCLAFLF